jgi:hypothetical protein
MSASATSHAVRTFLRALLTGDHELLTSVVLPHPDLATLTAARPPFAAVATAVADVARAPLRCRELHGERQLVHVRLGSDDHLIVVHSTTAGMRVDARWQLAQRLADDELRRTVRAFYQAWACGNRATLRELAFDTNGIDALADLAPPGADPAHAATMVLVELGLGESFAVPHGVQFVSGRHAEMGIRVLNGLLPDAEIPFLLRQRDGAWRVIPFHFLQRTAQPRGAAATT